MRKLLFLTYLLSMLTLIPDFLSAQVTIGSNKTPESFSILEVTTTETKGGLRLPQLTTTERDALGFTNSMGTVPNQGLTIYNLDSRCIEYWDNNKWVSLCLGTANITLGSSCGGEYDSQNPPVYLSDGSTVGCTYTPVDNPPCAVPSGQAYQVYLTGGSAYTTLTVDELTSAFSLAFQPNNSNATRTAIVRVVNNCSGEFQDFVFLQAGADCPSAASPILDINTGSLCSSGRVFAHVTNPEPGVNYVWAFGNVIVHTGNYIEADRAGIYRVYAGLLGCGTPATLTITANPGDNAAFAPTISATNSGILCNGGNVILTATNPTAGTVQWFHDGVPVGTSNPLTVSGASAAGEWFVSITDGTCYSASSNKLILTDETTGSTALDAPVATVNGQSLTGGSLILCQNGTLNLNVTNSASYPVGTVYEWFVNNVSIGSSSSPIRVYTLPANQTSVTLAVQVSNQGSNCPNTTVSQSTAVTLTAPSITNINNGAVNAYICGTTPALLVASISNGQNYEWYLNGALVATTASGQNSYSTSTAGTYTVRYQDANGCWSRLSAGIAVSVSNAIDMHWSIAPQDQEIENTVRNYSVVTAPVAEQYIWTAPGAVNITPFGNGSSAAIEYPAAGANITVTVQAVNACGTSTISKAVDVIAGCSPVTSVNITPNGATMTSGSSQTFTATAANATGFSWSLNGTPVGTGTTYTYSNAVYSDIPYNLTVTATGCNASQVSATAQIRVNPYFPGITPDNTGSYSLSGNTCFDVNMTSSEDCGLTSARTNYFENTFSFDYTFTNTAPATYTNLQFYTDDPSVLITSVANPSAQVYRITFRSDIRTFIRDNGTKSLQVIAVFNNNNGDVRKLTLTLNIQDCACCGAYVGPKAAPVWKNFMCHNLGADESLDPFTPTQAIFGDYFQWGRKTRVATSYDSSAAIPGWNSTAASTSAWQDGTKTSNDPCPPGYRVPTFTQWQQVKENNKVTYPGTWTNSFTNFSAGVYFGKRLFLPANGGRGNLNGTGGNRGLWASYWSSTYVGNGVGAMSASNTKGVLVQSTPGLLLGYSVRCIQE